jgi:soluble cytochrome b562
MEITMEKINEKFDLYVAAFEDLAEQEDKLEEMRSGLEDYKEGSPKHQEAMREVKAFEKTIATYQRRFRMAALELDRIKTLVDFMRP